MAPYTPSQSTSRPVERKPPQRYWTMGRAIFVGVTVGLLTKHSKFFLRVLSIPLLIVLGGVLGGIISVMNSDGAPSPPTGDATGSSSEVIHNHRDWEKSYD